MPMLLDPNEITLINQRKIPGHVDCGKSTVAGHLMYKVGAIDARTIMKFEREANEIGKGSFKYSWVLSKLKAERERGISINVSCWPFDSGKYDVTVIDVGGHRDFMRNALTGMSQADISILVIDASLGGFETGISEWGQTREHMLCSFALGLKQMIVLVNKMDDRSVNYSQNRFNTISAEVQRHLKRVGYNPKKVPIIPISGWVGDNLVERSQNLPWYRGNTFLKELNSMKIPKSQRQNHLPLRIPVSDSFKIGGIGTVLVGRVESGTISVGDVIEMAPCQRKVFVKSIEKNHRSIQRAVAGDRIGIGIEKQGINHRSVRRGFVIGNAHNNPPKVCERMEVKLVNIGHQRIRVGYEPVVDCRTNHCRCKIEKILSKIDKKTGDIIEVNPRELKKKEMGIVIMTNRLTKPTRQKVELVAEPFPHSSLGRIVVRDNRRIMAVGIIKKVYKRGVGWTSTFGSSALLDEDEKERREYVTDVEVIGSMKWCCSEFDIFGGETFLVWKSLVL